ncbi:MAG: NADH-quinone oxidoreductase subunit G [Rhodanobacteraceae bacterium]|nr:NADH-quinone oxidoreductase subunit G [Rhodanobacteraceae bacterium]MBP6078183.1 NADH-quinone oxidoreductase subunit G [Xanthomonadales bacterium]MBP7623095.1 NADH-quinone oxidoreductase subunit G [Xanthomonadales bacterium]
MSAQPSNTTAPDLVNIEVDGIAMQVPKGAMIIHATDKARVAVPRFCYHEKLPIAANCRMCLVDVEKAPKPVPACATPVMEGMKIRTRSERALNSQRNVMEFLLINHPLDCPVCDQGGECELQDVAMGYGRSVSRFVERKRVVADEDIGPLIATDMTRCIHCTRCVRFMSEIAGTSELGGIGRGENTEIGTYIGKSIESELGGNIIDVCPVGALTNKPFRFKARAWELIARESIGYHDALGSNLFLHTRRGEVLRTVPKDNEAINENWLSDRDRYSHQGLYAEDRATQPMVRGGDGELKSVSWEDAIRFVADGLTRIQTTHGGDQIAALVAPMASSEEGFLLAELLRGLGSANIDHRLRVVDAADRSAGATFEMPLADVEKAAAILLVGSNPRLDQPLLGHRIRKAWKRGAMIDAVNPIDFDFHFETASARIVEPWQMLDEVAAIAKAALELSGGSVDMVVAKLIAESKVDDVHRAIAKRLLGASSSVLVFGDFAVQHPAASRLRALARAVAQLTNTAFNEVASGANGVGLARVGVVPGEGGASAAQILAQPRKALLTWHAGSQDTLRSKAYDDARSNAEFHVYVGAYACNGVKRTAHAVLPIGLAPEIDGSYVNVDGSVQIVAAGAKLPGEARAGWRVLRALGAALGVSNFDFTDIADVRARMGGKLGAAVPMSAAMSDTTKSGVGLTRIATVPIYRADAVLRRSSALLATPLAQPAGVALNPADFLAAGLTQGGRAKVSDGTNTVELPAFADAGVPTGAAWVELGHSETAALAPNGAGLTVTRV